MKAALFSNKAGGFANTESLFWAQRLHVWAVPPCPPLLTQAVAHFEGLSSQSAPAQKGRARRHRPFTGSQFVDKAGELP